MKCYCITCKKFYHRLGIARHRAMHRDKKENCTIRYSSGYVFEHGFSEENSKIDFQNSETVGGGNDNY